MMEYEAAKYMRTYRHPGALEPHPILNAVVLNYEVDVQIVGTKENVLYGDKKAVKKIIEIPMLNSRTDCVALAREVVHQCDLIHHSRLDEVEQIIYYLKRQKVAQGAISAKGEDRTTKSAPSIGEDANYLNLPQYIDLLYEGMQEKIKGAQLINLLAKDPENLNALSKNETVISALGRVLREDWKRSIVLSTHLIFTFFRFSVYTQFHNVILKCKVGSICMEIIDFELRRYDRWQAELAGSPPPDDLPIIGRRSWCLPDANDEPAQPKSRIPEPVRPKSGSIPTKSIDGSVYDDLSASMDCFDFETNNNTVDQTERMKRFRTLVRKQEHLLRVAIYLLLNIAEDRSVEEKMARRNIVGLLVKTLERENEEMLVLVVTFLKKLSITDFCKDAMISLALCDKLSKLLDSPNPDLVHLTLKLASNLCCDVQFRRQTMKIGLLAKFLSLLSHDRHQEIVLKLLYQLSLDSENWTYFVDGVDLIIDMLVLNCAVNNAQDEVMLALCVNIAIHPDCAGVMVRKNRLQPLMHRAFTYHDCKVMKLLRNISEHVDLRTNFIEFVGDLSRNVTTDSDDNFTVETLGVLTNLNLPKLDWREIFKHFNLPDWIRQKFGACATVDPELLLQIVALIGTAASSDGACAQLLCENGILRALIDILKVFQEDDEYVLQIVYAFLATMTHGGDNIDYVIKETEAPAYFIDLLEDANEQISTLCSTCLNLIGEHSEQWAERIKIEKFRRHNAQWLEMVDTHQLPAEEEEDGTDDALPPYLNTEYLSTAVIQPLNGVEDTVPNQQIVEAI